MNDIESEWLLKGATLSDKTARKEFGLTQDEIVQAIRAGELQCRQSSMHGNPWFRLLRKEVEAFVKTKHGLSHLENQKAKAELVHVNQELRRLKRKVTDLEKRKAQLLAETGDHSIEK